MLSLLQHTTTNTKPEWSSVTLSSRCYFLPSRVSFSPVQKHVTTQQAMIILIMTWSWCSCCFRKVELKHGMEILLNFQTVYRSLCSTFLKWSQQMTKISKKKQSLPMYVFMCGAGSGVGVCGNTLSTILIWPGPFTFMSPTTGFLALFNQSPLTLLIIQIHHSWGKWRLPL